MIWIPRPDVSVRPVLCRELWNNIRLMLLFCVVLYVMGTHGTVLGGAPHLNAGQTVTCENYSLDIFRFPKSLFIYLTMKRLWVCLIGYKVDV